MNAQANADAAEIDFRIYTTEIDASDLKPLVDRLLPDQGCIEVQRDVEGKEHAWHTHGTDETLVILSGQLRFYWDSGEKIAGPGTVIALPAGMPHGSVALEGGATYLIAFDHVDLQLHD
jgi:quercetin dioxygenase-like cupin family protein